MNEANVRSERLVGEISCAIFTNEVHFEIKISRHSERNKSKGEIRFERKSKHKKKVIVFIIFITRLLSE